MNPQGLCHDTPYEDYRFAKTPEEALKAAKAELRLLRSLRPKKGKK